MMEKIRIIIVEDDSIVRFALTKNLAELPELEIVGVAESGEEALALIEKKKPDVALIDYFMPYKPGTDKYDLIQKSKTLCPTLRIITLSSIDNPYALSLALQAGASAIIHKIEAPDRNYVLDVIQKIVKHKNSVCLPKILNLEHLIRHAQLEQENIETLLNKTQFKIMALTAEQKKIKEIAHILKKSEGHVRDTKAQIIKLLHKKGKIKKATDDSLIDYYKKLYPN